MTAPAWAGNYIGRPYSDKGRGPDAWDCWGLARQILSDVAGHSLPDYSNAYTEACDPDSVAGAVVAGLQDGWQRVERPQALDLLILRIAGRPWHCAVMLDAAMFIHVMPPGRNDRQTFSCIERLDSPHWARRVDGFWRRTPAQNGV